MPAIIRTTTNRFRQKDSFHGGRGSSGICSCSWLLIIVWSFIVVWMVFLGYCYRYGLINDQKIHTLVNNVDFMINKTEESFLRHGKHSLSLTHALHPDHPVHQIQQQKTTIKTGSTESHTAVVDPLPTPSEDDVYVIFSTDCNPYQDWQSLILFHSAKRVQQKGRVIRIASGCTPEKQQQLTDLYYKLYRGYYYGHFTPDFKKDAKTNRKYDFYNKPWGLKHWLEHSEHPIPENALIALLDPDMIFLRPITPYLTSNPYIINKRIPKDEIVDRIGAGHPVAQTYGLGAPWTNDNHKHFKRGKICGENSPCLEPNMQFGELHYAVGPPYVVQKSDFVRIANSWTWLVPRVYEGYPYLLAEMYAYSMAAAHERLPHLQVDHYMVSNVDSFGEGWEWIDALSEVCLPPQGKEAVFYPDQKMPTVIHYCQSYRAGEYFFGKRRVPHDLFNCEHPLFVDIPPETAKADYFINKKEQKEKVKNARRAKRDAFMVCAISSAINLALIDYKQKICGPQNHTNYEKTYKL